MRLKVFMENNTGTAFRRGLAVVLLAALAFGAAACTTSTGLIDAATTVAEDRPMAQVARDAEIKLDINKRLLGEKNRDLFFDVSTDVYEGRVMLTGSVKNARDRQRAGNLATDIPGIKIIYNDLQVTRKEGFKSSANDIWIETKIKAQLYAEKGIKSIHFRFRSVNTEIYLLGRARTLEEMGKVVQVIKRTKHVTRLVNHAVIRPVAAK